MDSLIRIVFPFLVPGLVSLAGCSSSPAVDPAAVAKFQKELTLAEEPDGVQTVSELRLAMLGEEAPDVLSLIETGAGEEHAEHSDEGEAHADHAEHADEHEEQADHADESQADAETGEGTADTTAAAPEGETPAKPLIEEMDVVLVGVVGGIPNPSPQSHPEFPFAPGEAMFFLADPEAVAELEEHGHQHAPGEECAFCAAHAADATALVAGVTFHDDAGKVVPIDVRELFDLKEKDVVVVQGKARVRPHGMISVDATGLYVRR